MIVRTILAAALTIAGFTASAAPVLFECDVTEKHRRLGWIADKIVFVVEANGQVTVIDPIIQQFDQDPMIAKVTRNTNKTLKVRWALRDITNGSNQTATRFDFDATINKKTNRIAVYARPAGFPNRFSGKGSCKTHTDGKLPATLR